jgi:hypothetical protein
MNCPIAAIFLKEACPRQLEKIWAKISHKKYYFKTIVASKAKKEVSQIMILKSQIINMSKIVNISSIVFKNQHKNPK